MPNTHQLPDLLREIQALSGDLLPAVILSTTWPTVPAPPALTFAAFATRGYVKDGTTLIYVDQPAHALSLGSSDGQYWLALFRDTSTPVSGWARQPGTHYLLNSGASQPATPPGALLFASALVSGGAITSVTPLPAVMGNPPAWRGHLGLGTMATQDANAVAITGGTATLTGTPVPLTVQGDALVTRLGIGTSPDRALAVQGDLYVSATSQLTGAVGLGVVPDGSLQLLVGPGPSVLQGALGVNNVVPTAALDVNGSVYVRAYAGLGEPPQAGFGLLVANAPSILRGTLGVGNTAPGAFTLNVNGSAGNPGGVWSNTTSFARLKRAIRPLHGAVALLTRLRPRAWDWSPDAGVCRDLPGMGFVLDEVAEDLPAWVARDAEGQPVGLREAGATALLTAVLQEVLTRLARVEAVPAANGATSA